MGTNKNREIRPNDNWGGDVIATSRKRKQRKEHREMCNIDRSRTALQGLGNTEAKKRSREADNMPTMKEQAKPAPAVEEEKPTMPQRKGTQEKPEKTPQVRRKRKKRRNN